MPPPRQSSAKPPADKVRVGNAQCSIGLAGAYGIYTVAAVLSVFFVLRFVHETKGRELEQMEG